MEMWWLIRRFGGSLDMWWLIRRCGGSLDMWWLIRRCGGSLDMLWLIRRCGGSLDNWWLIRIFSGSLERCSSSLERCGGSFLEMCWLIVGDAVVYWKRSRRLKHWSRVRIRHLSQWKTLKTSSVPVYTVKVSGQKGKPSFETKRIFQNFLSVAAINSVQRYGKC